LWWWVVEPCSLSLLHSCDAWEELGRRLLGWRRKEREKEWGEKRVGKRNTHTTHA
jgi:hypothetical protein